MLGSDDLPVWGIIRIPLAYLRPDKSQNDACMATNKSQATFRLAKPYRKWSDSDRGILTQAILCHDDIWYGRSSTAAEWWKGLWDLRMHLSIPRVIPFPRLSRRTAVTIKKKYQEKIYQWLLLHFIFQDEPRMKVMSGGFEGFWDPPK